MIPNPYDGIFIVFDGNDGSGKTEQLKRTAAWLRSLDILRHTDVIETKEPDKNGIFGKKIYEDLAQEGGLHQNFPYRFQMWYACDSKEHLISKIIPALEVGSVVLSDRFRSSMVYGASNEKKIDRFMQMNQAILGEHFIWPDLILIFDVPVRVSIERLRQKGLKLDGHERSEVLQRVRRNFLAFAEMYPNCTVIPAESSLEEVHRKVKLAILTVIKIKKHIT